jgi:hypothetical protein
MKKSLLFLLAGLVISVGSVGFCFAQVQDWTTANQINVAWDAVTQLADGRPIPAGTTVSYKVYTRPDGMSTPNTFILETAVLEAPVTFSIEGKHLVGVSAVRNDSGVPVGETAISWSDNPAVVSTAGTWGVVYYVSLMIPRGLRHQ